MNAKAITTYLQQHARPLDLALHNFYCGTGDSQSVLNKLATYQNNDGGFSKGIEPDTQLPLSSAIGTSVAFQYLTAVEADASEPLVQQGVAYLLSTHNRQTNGWDIVPKEVDDFPHAPWWSRTSSFGPSGFGWGNPAAEILGYLLRYGTLAGDNSLLKTVTQAALHRLAGLVDPDFHELLCYARLYNCADRTLQAQLYPTLSQHIAATVNTNPGDWGPYGATPLTFVKSPDSPFASLFNASLLQANLDHIEQSAADDHWEPNWDWGGDYPAAWNQAKRDWSGKLTVENAQLLRLFGRL